MVATQILAMVEKGRLQKAVEGFVRGAYTIALASQAEEEIRGFVANGDGKQYGVVLSEGSNTCLCRFSEAFITSKHFIEGFIGERTAQA